MTQPARVLVIDDSPTIRKVVSAILTRHGFETTLAADGQAGIEKLDGDRIDLILLDFVMPRMNGYQFCRELRSKPAHRRMPVVLMSAKGDKIRGQFVQQTGAVDALTKPFDARALVAVVQGALAKTAAGRARPVPEGETMPDEEALAESVRPSQLPNALRARAHVDAAQVLGAAITPVVLGLTPEERGSEAPLLRAIAEALSPDVLKALGRALEDASPDNKNVVLSGDLTSIPIAEVLQTLSMQQQSGILRLSNAKTTITISLRQGKIDLVQSRGAGDEFLLGRYFIEKGLITREQLDEALRSKENPQMLLGDVLLQRELISRDQLHEALTRQSSELIYDAIGWRYGRFRFSREGPVGEAGLAQLELGVSELVLEGYRRVDEWRFMEASIDFDKVPYVDEGALEKLDEARVTETDRRVLEAIDGKRSVQEVVTQSAVSSFDALRIIYQFNQTSIVRMKG